jgi:hypothetical protein
LLKKLSPTLEVEAPSTSHSSSRFECPTSLPLCASSSSSPRQLLRRRVEPRSAHQESVLVEASPTTHTKSTIVVEESPTTATSRRGISDFTPSEDSLQPLPSARPSQAPSVDKKLSCFPPASVPESILCTPSDFYKLDHASRTPRRDSSLHLPRTCVPPLQAGPRFSHSTRSLSAPAPHVRPA